MLFGNTVSGRPAELSGVEEMVGMFINTLPVRVKINAEMSVFEWLKNIQAEQIESKDYEHSPLVEVQKWSEVPRKQALFESILIFENYPSINSEKNHLGFTVNDIHVSEKTNYPLTIVVIPGNNFLLKCIFNCTRFDFDTISRLLEHFKKILENIAEFSDKPVNYKSILSDEELHLLQSWNQTETDYPKDQTIVDLFQAQVEKTPDNIAVDFDNQQLSYRALNTKANQLAHYLIALGVNVETLVGICVERSLEMVIGLLGILKAGGAYVPLDPDYPQERLQFMLGRLFTR